MRWVVPAFVALLSNAGVAHGAESTQAPTPGRYMLGGTDSDGLILLDTATGRTWKYDRDAKPPYKAPVWLPLHYKDSSAPRDSTGPAPADPRDESGDLGITPSPYKAKRPGYR